MGKRLFDSGAKSPRLRPRPAFGRMRAYQPRITETAPFALSGKGGCLAKPFGEYDDGGDIVETAYLVQGMLTARQYFDDPNDLVEMEIRSIVRLLWNQVEWDWYLQHPDSQTLYWHWSPNHEWHMNHAVKGYNECMIAYLLAIASPTHPIPSSCYYNGWAGSADYANGNTYYDYKQWVGPEKGGPLFFTHYSHLGFDPRDKSDDYCNYFDNSMNIYTLRKPRLIVLDFGRNSLKNLFVVKQPYW